MSTVKDKQIMANFWRDEARFLKGFKQSNRYLTVALGGDDRNAATKRDVNYKLTVKVHKK